MIATTDKEDFIRKMNILNDRDSIFKKRTEKTSAEQYFQFYGYLSQQQNMMQDYIRTSTYQKAMLENTDDFTDKVRNFFFCNGLVLNKCIYFEFCIVDLLSLQLLIFKLFINENILHFEHNLIFILTSKFDFYINF